MSTPSLNASTKRSTIAVLTLALWALLGSAPAPAFNGPYASLVDVGGGVMLDVDVRWPDAGSPPPAGWPVVFWAHGAGGSKNSNAGRAATYADTGYVTLSYTNRPDATSQVAETFASDLTALKSWLVNDFETEASVTVPVDSASFGISGNSLGGYVSWSGGLLTNEFATVVPFNWSIHAFVDHFVTNGSIERQTAAPLAAALFPALEYPATATDAALEGAFGAPIAAFPTLTIPVMNHLAMLDSRTSGTVALTDHLALTSASHRIVYLGTGGHGTPNDDATFRDDLRDRWFDFHLKGESTGIDTELPIQMALLVTNEKLLLPSWPPPDQQSATVYLHEAALLHPNAPSGAQPADAFVNDPGAFTWFDAAPGFSSGTIRSNVPQEIVAYETPPLTEEVLLVGQPSATLHVEGTASRYQVNVHLYDVPPASDKALLAFGTATVDASPTTAAVTLSVTGRRVPVGHALRLEITNRDDQDLNHTNGYQPESGQLRYAPFFEHSTTRVFHDVARPSSLVLPLIGRNDLPVTSTGCDPIPRTGCRLSALPGKSLLRLKNFEPDKRDQVQWKWSKGSETGFADLGDPLATDGYAFCLYDGSTLLFGMDAPEGGLCPEKPCWKQLGSASNPRGFRYRDKEQAPNGFDKLILKSGDTFKAKVIVKGKGENLGDGGGLPTTPLPLPLTAQVQSTTGECFEATYTTATQNEGGLFKAK